MKTYQALSALLSYPTADIQAAAGEIRTILFEEMLVPLSVLQSVQPLIDNFETQDLNELQERYVLLFDRTRSLSLHLFEHVHGESRDRGQAMVDLQTLYAQGGLEIDARELPDYLPLFLEFLSTRSDDEARTLLAEAIGVLVALKERLAKRNTPYTAVFYFLESIVGKEPEKSEIEELRKAPDDDPNDFEALDAAWEDRPITFGPGQEGCPKIDEVLKRMNVDDGGSRRNITGLGS